jgi:hypothetical protein
VVVVVGGEGRDGEREGAEEVECDGFHGFDITGSLLALSGEENSQCAAAAWRSSALRAALRPKR